MSRVVLFHWNTEEAADRSARLRRAGHHVACVAGSAGTALRSVGGNPPDTFVIDLGRSPSQGCAVAVWLRQQKATRHTPIVFVEGDREKTARVRELLPDATYTSWAGIATALRRALGRARPRDPIVPGTMDSYAGTPLPRKLGIRPASCVVLAGAPRGFDQVLAPLPQDVRIRRRLAGRADVILLFVRSSAELRLRFPAAARILAEHGRVWILWPKRASRVTTDLTQPVVRAFGMGAGFVDYKVAAIDATWSGLCFARRHAQPQGKGGPR